MNTITLTGPRFLPSTPGITRLLAAGRDRLVALANGALTARYGRPPPEQEEDAAEAEDLQTLFAIALMCAVH